MTTTTPDGRARKSARTPRAPQAATSPAPPVAGVTGVATGNLGTGTAVTDETTLIETPSLPEPVPVPVQAREPEPAAVPESVVPETVVPESATAPAPLPAQPPRPRTTRRDPYRPIGIALAAILVALAGVAVLSNGANGPTDVVGPPAATAAPSLGTGADQGDRDPGKEPGGGPGNGNGRGGNGNGNGHGNGNGGPR
jgi:hypothetical protein